MLVAIMGETFGQNRLVQDQLRFKQHLKFIVNNVKGESLGSISKDIEKVNYLITAFITEEDEEEVEIIKEHQEEVSQMKNQNQQDMDNILQELKKIKMKLN